MLTKTKLLDSVPVGLMVLLLRRLDPRRSRHQRGPAAPRSVTPDAQAGTSHSHAGSSASSRRIRSRPRLRVGPMLPIGIFSAVEIEA